MHRHQTFLRQKAFLEAASVFRGLSRDGGRPLRDPPTHALRHAGRGETGAAPDQRHRPPGPDGERPPAHRGRRIPSSRPPAVTAKRGEHCGKCRSSPSSMPARAIRGATIRSIGVALPQRHAATEDILKLPNAHALRVDREKVVAYLLSHEHPDGRAKALFFERVGFEAEAWETFAAALRAHGRTHEVATVVESRFGTRYIVDGKLTSPDGRNPLIRTVWIVEKTQATPRLVTAYPLQESR